MEAEWDPIAGKVVYRKTESKPSDSPKKAGDQPAWREDDSEHDGSARRRPRSYGVKPSHPVTKDIEDLHKGITKAVFQRKTQTVRASHDRRRSAYNALSVYKTFPLQELAISYLQELRQEWGVEPDEVTMSLPNQDATSCASSDFSTTSIGQPEPKRHISGRIGNNEQSIQELKEEFLKQRTAHPDPSVFANPLHSLEPRIWGMEAATTGKRRYVVAHAGRFFDHYWRKTIPADRHGYELIRPNTPCRLYLDIECTQDQFLNSSEHLQDELLYELWLLLKKEIEERFQDFTVDGNHLAPLNRHDNLIDLESNSTAKFSRHWIFHLKTTADDEVLFPNNITVGSFVKEFISRLADDSSWREDYPVLSKYLFLSNTCLLDLGVYTRNRIFRLLGSCKFGKQAPLHVARSNQFDLGIANDCVLLRSEACQDIDEQVKETFRRMADWSDHARALAETLVVPLNSSKLSYPLLPIAQEEASTPQSGQLSVRRSATSHQRGQSKYPAIEEYIIERFGDRGGFVGRVRVWSIFEDRILSYHMMDNRWCENIGRQHKSNNIVWNVDLVNHTCYQTCHDPDCRGFRGEVYAIPDELFDDNQGLTHYSDDDEFFGDDEFEEALAALNIDDVVANFQAQKAKTTQSFAAPRNDNSPTTIVPVDKVYDEQLATKCTRRESRFVGARVKDKDGIAVNYVSPAPNEDCARNHVSYSASNHDIGSKGRPELTVETMSVNSLNEGDFASWLDSPDSVTETVHTSESKTSNQQENKSCSSKAATVQSDPPVETPRTIVGWHASPGNSSREVKPDSFTSARTAQGYSPHHANTSCSETEHIPAQTVPAQTAEATRSLDTSSGQELTLNDKGFASWLDSPENETKGDVKVPEPTHGFTEKFASWLDDSDESDDGLP